MKEKKKHNKCPPDSHSYRYRRHCSSRSFLCSFVFFFFFSLFSHTHVVVNNDDAGSGSRSKVMSAVSQRTQKNLFKTHTSKRRRKKWREKDRMKKNRTLCALRCNAFFFCLPHAFKSIIIIFFNIFSFLD